MLTTTNRLPPAHLYNMAAAAKAGFERTAQRAKSEKQAYYADLAAVAAETVRLLRSGEVKPLRPEPVTPSAGLPTPGDPVATAAFVVRCYNAARGQRSDADPPVGPDGRELDPGSLAAFVVRCDRMRRGVAA
jgi:hypothetical protein